MKHTITRRDFVNGIALTAAGVGLSPLDAMATGLLPSLIALPEYYPPKLTGMRGSHPGSFEIAHRLAWGGGQFDRPRELTDDIYDLVVVGAGISGLAAAWFYRNQAGQDARILIIDNHDDFGGHATRNEFEVNGKKLIGYGGSESISEPSGYSEPSNMLLKSIGIEIDRFEKYYDTEFYRRHGLRDGIYLSAPSFGHSTLMEDVLGLSLMESSGRDMDERLAILAGYPLTEQTKSAFKRLISGDFEFMADAPQEARKKVLSEMKGEEFLRSQLGMGDDGIFLMRDSTRLETGYSTDVFSASDMAGYGLMDWEHGFALLEAGRGDYYDHWYMRLATSLSGELGEPYIYHFPDGNAGIARVLVRSLIPGSATGSTMEDIVTAPIDYGMIDRETSNVRIRLNSTVVDARNVGNQWVDVTYAGNSGTTTCVRAKHCVMACYNAFIPYLCPEVSEKQATALAHPEKTPQCFINVALNNWRAIKKAGYNRIYAPGAFLTNIWMDFPVSMGGYRFTSDPDEPTLIQVFHIPTATDEYDNLMDQARGGRYRLLSMTFDDFEREIINQLDAIWGPYGFRASRDISAITVNRWPHGYAHEYLSLWDHPDVAIDGPEAPHVIGRAQLGRISIANSDSEASAYVDAAMKAAWRAVQEQVS